MTRQYIRRNTVESEDLGITQPEDISDVGLLERESPVIAQAEDNLSAKAYFDELAFMEERVRIVLHRGREKHSPDRHDFYVNGVPLWIPVDTECEVPRKYVEVMARSQPYDVQTMVEGEDSDKPVNTIKRYQSAKYPFAVIEDRNPKGRAWLSKVMRES